MHGLNLPSSSTPRDFAVSEQKLVCMAVYAVEDVDFYSSIMQVSAAGGYHRARQGNSMGRLHGVLVQKGQLLSHSVSHELALPGASIGNSKEMG